MERLRDLSFSSDDSIQIIDLCERCIKEVIVIGRDIEEKEHLVL